MIFEGLFYRRRKYIKIDLISNDIVNKLTIENMLLSYRIIKGGKNEKTG
jgi:hypothetical protein